jgi:hypothetical protein
MKYTKRVVSLFIIATMLMSMLSAFVAVPVMAINAPVVYDETGAAIVEGDDTAWIFKDTTLNVTGSGVTAGETVNIYWDFVQAAYLMNSTTAKNDGRYTCLIDVPAAYNGSHYVWAKDLSTGLSERCADTVNVWPSVSLDPASALAEDDFEVTGYGFMANEDVLIDVWDGAVNETLAFWDESTDDDGTVVLDSAIPDWSDGQYNVTIEDETGNVANATLTIGPALVLDVTVGPVGTVVKAEGRGFGNSIPIAAESNMTLHPDGETWNVTIDTKDGEDITTSSTGTFTAYIIIPWAPVGDYEVNITDGNVWASDDFEVDGESGITVTPTYGTPGTVLTVVGENFTRISGTDVDLTLESQVASANTDATGSFTATITVPPLDFGTRYDVIAEDERNCNGTDDVLVALIVLQLSDYSAPVGSEVTLMGSGFTENEEYNATLGDMPIIETTDIVGAFTYFSHVWYVPSVPSGTYTIYVRDIVEEIEVGIDFTVTDQAALSVSRAQVPNMYNLTLEGTGFVELEAQSTEWWIYNSTDAWDLDIADNVTYGGVNPETDEDGAITGYYQIPEFLELGTYTINCTTVSNDPAGEDWEVTQYAEVDIEIVPEEVVLSVGNPSYARGQTVTFVIKATLKKDPFYLGIKDPEGGEVFNSTWNDASWGTLGSWFYIPSNRQIDAGIGDVYSLPADAMAGTWTYAFWDDEKTYATGTFEVTELTEIEQLQQDIGEVSSSLLDLGTSVTDLAGSVVAVSGAAAEAAAAAAAASAAAGDAKDAADAAAAAVADVGDTANDALDAANDAKTSADAAKTAADSGLAAANDAKATAQAAADAATDAKDAAEGAQTAASGLTTLVYGAIGASLIAALAAIVSLMQISRRIAG